MHATLGWHLAKAGALPFRDIMLLAFEAFVAEESEHSGSFYCARRRTVFVFTLHSRRILYMYGLALRPQAVGARMCKRRFTCPSCCNSSLQTRCWFVSSCAASPDRSASLLVTHFVHQRPRICAIHSRVRVGPSCY